MGEGLVIFGALVILFGAWEFAGFSEESEDKEAEVVKKSPWKKVLAGLGILLLGVVLQYFDV